MLSLSRFPHQNTLEGPSNCPGRQVHGGAISTLMNERLVSPDHTYVSASTSASTGLCRRYRIEAITVLTPQERTLW